jgi:hypothetical protein
MAKFADLAPALTSKGHDRSGSSDTNATTTESTASTVSTAS